jgi:hypothetical protein
VSARQRDREEEEEEGKPATYEGKNALRNTNMSKMRNDKN